MMSKDVFDPALAESVEALRAQDTPFAIATVIRTAGLTAAKPGAKALLRGDGTIMQGWLGGGCIRGAVKAAVLKALENGEPQLISIAPEDVLSEKGHKVGEIVDGVAFARNGCPSRGTIDMFVEPYLPRPELVVFGGSPVAQALADLAPRFDWATRCLDAGQVPQNVTGRQRAIVIATQGQGDLQALQTALASPSRYVGFVGSRLKFAALSAKLTTANVPAERIARVQAPAGLDIGAVTPEEIALSILATLTQQRRRPAIDIAE